MLAAVGASLERHVATGQRLLAGLSGGVDSVVLLHVLNRLAPARGATLRAVYVHHGLSPHADAWASHCRMLCAEWDIPLAIEGVEVERGSCAGLEGAARVARHRVFARSDADWIVLAHHRDDQAETLLFNLLRGTGLRGAAAMREAQGRLLRPLLGVSRVTIAAYAGEHELRWIEDESNADTRFSRNHLRHEVLAGLEQRFPGSGANLAAAAGRFGEAEMLIDDLAQMDLGAQAPEFPLDVAVLAALAEPRARNVLRFLLRRHHVGIPSEERLREALRQLVEAAPDRHPAVVFGAHKLLRRGRRIFLEPV
ncbi:MAG: tRNA lysidine(34) synthetase TilS [Rhodocyclales bacterium]|nr:tRNA lysidine(34) synthetase TilS [Rhodocyclales bacterium]